MIHWAILIVEIILISAILNYQIRSKQICNKVPRVGSFSDIIGRVRTGDLILSKGNYDLDCGVKSWLRACLQTIPDGIYSHISCIVVLDDVYVLTSNYRIKMYDYMTNTYKSGVALVKFADYYSHASGQTSVLLWYPMRDHIVSTDVALGALSALAGKEYPVSIMSQIRAYLRTNELSNERNCCQTVVEFLTRCGILFDISNDTLGNITMRDIKLLYKSDLYYSPIVIETAGYRYLT